MKSFVIISLLALLFMEEATSTHLETCNCNEIRSIVNESIEQAVAKLENKLLLELNSAITNKTLQDMDSSLTSTIERLLKPIQEQLNYHLPPPPSTSPAPPPSTQAPTQMPTQAPNSEENPAKSCKDLYSNVPDAESSYYWIKTSSGSPARVYCKMDADCQNMTGGWMRVAYIDMRNSSHQCPSGMTLRTRSSAPRRVCDVTFVSTTTCASNNFTAHGISYSHVYGRIKAYQNEYTIAFRFNRFSIEQAYVFGVSLTHGQNPRRHIWTFAGATDETSIESVYKCPCINSNISPSSISIPSFVGNDYFCDTALVNNWSTYSRALYPSDPLWDGEGCGPNNTCCSVPNLCGNNSPPWFIKHLPSSTTDDVEMRLCQPANYEGTTPIEIVELYVQ